jgi:hypothetical protein
MSTMYMRNVGLLPLAAPAVVVAAGSAIEVLHSWYDPNFYQRIWLEGDLEKQVELLNNYFQNLWRSAVSAGLSRSSPAMKRLDADMGAWVRWKSEYNEAILRRWLPFGRDWEDELKQYRRLFERNYNDILIAGAERAREELQSRGVRPELLPAQDSAFESAQQAFERVARGASAEFGETARSAIFWPSVAVVTAGIGITWLLVRASRPAR